MGTVTIHHTYFLESDIFEGDFPRDDTDAVVYDELTAREAADKIRSEGLTFEHSDSYAYDPDGSRYVDYSTGRRVETVATLSGFHPRVMAAIMAAVDRTTT